MLNDFRGLFFNETDLGLFFELVLFFDALAKFFDVLGIFGERQIESTVIFDDPRGGLTFFVAITLANADVTVIAVFDDADIDRHKTKSSIPHNATYPYAT